MKKLLLMFVLITTPAMADPNSVSGYYRNNGTYVQPYKRSHPNRSFSDSYSPRECYKPYAGTSGTIPNYAPTYVAPQPVTHKYHYKTKGYGLYDY